MSYMYIYIETYAIFIHKRYQQIFNTFTWDCFEDERSHSWKFVFVYTGPECGGQEGGDGAGTGL